MKMTVDIPQGIKDLLTLSTPNGFNNLLNEAQFQLGIQLLLNDNPELTCFPFIVKTIENPFFEQGEYNGYIAIRPNEKLEKVKNRDTYNQCGHLFNVHGGITYESYHYEKYVIKYLIIGFDTAHHNDTPEKWTKVTVWEETMDLFWQVLDYIK